MGVHGRGLSRREFLGAGVAAGAGALLLGGAAGAVAPGRAKAKGGDVMPRRALGRTGAEIPVIGLGASGDLSADQLILGQCVKRGVTYWDTSDNYSDGKAEIGIGRYFAKHPADRKRVFLVTKAGVGDAASLNRQLAQSLQRMKTDHIDAYFFHGVDGIGEVDKPELRTWAEAARKGGKIRFIGLSTHKNMAAVMTGAAKLGWIDCLMTTCNYRIMHDDDMRRALEACAAAGVGVAAMKTQGGGPINDTAADRELAGRLVAKGVTPEQAKIKAILEHPEIATACLSMPNVEILKSCVAAVMDGKKLGAAGRDALAVHAAATHGSVCGACGRCERACRVPVSRVMRHLMYARNYGDTAMARARFRALGPAVHGRMASADFSKAEHACPHTLPIGRLMKEALLELA
ncbi:MAG: aldo/keto reductase [Candidatus Coatesbacteria bacterium]